MYRGPSSACAHTDPQCRALRRCRAVRVDDSAARRLPQCQYCARACLVCGDDGALIAPCGEHALCVDCLTEHVQREAATLDALPACPCRAGATFDARWLPRCVRAALAPSAARAVASAAVAPPADAALECLTLRCPHCAAAFYDFDGCAAIYCTCRGWFCALCLQPCRDRDAAHAHVASCARNPNAYSYFVSHVQYEDVRRALIIDRLGAHLRGLHLFAALREWRRVRGWLEPPQKMAVLCARARVAVAPVIDWTVWALAVGAWSATIVRLAHLIASSVCADADACIAGRHAIPTEAT